MKRNILGTFLILTFVFSAIAQNVKNDSASSASIDAATSVSAQLESSLDVRKAKVGEEVILKTKKAIKENGQTLIQKGSTLVGRVTEVQERTKGMAASKIGILFHTLNQNGQSLPVNAMITSITRTSAYGGGGANDDIFASTSASSSIRANTQSSSGGLLGGVGNTVGGVANSGTSTVSNVTNTTGQVLGSTVNTVGRTTGAVTSNIPGLQVSNSADASVSGGSTLSLTGNNLKLDKGTNFGLSIQRSSSVSTSKKTN